jgi:hypothetical protein
MGIRERHRCHARKGAPVAGKTGNVITSREGKENGNGKAHQTPEMQAISNQPVFIHEPSIFKSNLLPLDDKASKAGKL